MDISLRITNDLINELKDNEIFVFGSNLSGIHGAGAAKTALKWGAVFGQPYHLQGKTFAIPTKDARILKSLPIEQIKIFVDDFILFANINPNLTFLVTEIGCGLAGLTPKDVAPLFKNAINLPNVKLPQKFWDVLNASESVS